MVPTVVMQRYKVIHTASARLCPSGEQGGQRSCRWIPNHVLSQADGEGGKAELNLKAGFTYVVNISASTLGVTAECPIRFGLCGHSVFPSRKED